MRAAGNVAVDRRLALDRLKELIGQDLRQLADELGVVVWHNGKMEKGWAGHVVERYLGLPLNSSRIPNLGSWELKVLPMKINAKGEWVPKETMAITMLDPVEVEKTPFEKSHLYMKLRKLIVVLRAREDNEETHSTCMDICSFDLQETVLYQRVAKDYGEIQRAIKENGFEALTGRIGTYIQPRTKGTGHGSTSRAFYAKKKLLEYVVGKKEAPRLRARLRPDDCPIHAGKANDGAREPLDSLIEHLPANQSGAGRHKCPYCAYERGYRQALDDVLASVGERQR